MSLYLNECRWKIYLFIFKYLFQKIVEVAGTKKLFFIIDTNFA